MTSKEATSPADIKVDKKRLLKVLWKDGHESRYPFDYLRHICPCAICRDLRKKGKEAPPRVLPEGSPVAVDTAEVVGRYALNFRWNDGHSTGIYAFNLLRDRCPCGRCVPETDLSAEGEALERESREKNSSLWAD